MANVRDPQIHVLKPLGMAWDGDLILLKPAVHVYYVQQVDEMPDGTKAWMATAALRC